MANSKDPDETAHDEPSHQDLHCLQKNGLVCRVEGFNFIIYIKIFYLSAVLIILFIPSAVHILSYT